MKTNTATSETEMIVSLIENKSDFNLPTEVTLWNQGGNVTVEDFMVARLEESLKMELQNIPENQRSTQYIEFTAEHFYQELKVGDRILVAINVKEDGSFYTTIGGYSNFKEVENTRELIDFKNVITEEVILTNE